MLVLTRRILRLVVTDVFGYGWQPAHHATSERLSSVVNYLKLSSRQQRRIVAALGSRDLMTAAAHKRVSHLINRELVDQLAVPALEAILVARQVDAELATRLKEAQSAVLALLGLFNICTPGCGVGSVLKQLETISEANVRVSGRIRELARDQSAAPRKLARVVPPGEPLAQA
jgi:hypothetical protein